MYLDTYVSGVSVYTQVICYLNMSLQRCKCDDLCSVGISVASMLSSLYIYLPKKPNML